MVIAHLIPLASNRLLVLVAARSVSLLIRLHHKSRKCPELSLETRQTRGASAPLLRRRALTEILSVQSEPGERRFRRPRRTSKLHRLPPSLSCNALRRAGEFTRGARRARMLDFRPCKLQPNRPALFGALRYDAPLTSIVSRLAEYGTVLRFE